MPQWIREGLVFAATGQHWWMLTHTQLPVVDRLEGGRWRVYFATRDAQSRSRIGFVEVSASRPRRVLRVSERPALELGALGCFDDMGVLPSWIVNTNGRKLLYYIGINTATNMPGRAAIGVAESHDGGERFSRIFEGPILGPLAEEPHICTAPCVLPGDPWRMWYVSGLGWDTSTTRAEPRYLIRQTDSQDGLRWNRPGELAVGFADSHEAGLARPAVLRSETEYRMWFCVRGGENYRTGGESAYRLAYAESADGRVWQRSEEEGSLRPADSGWDREMIAYPYVFHDGDGLTMVYNGNGFGRSGFGIAHLEEFCG